MGQKTRYRAMRERMGGRRERTLRLQAHEAWGLTVLRLLVALRLGSLAMRIAPRLPLMRLRKPGQPWSAVYGRDIPDLKRRVLGSGSGPD